MKMSGKRLLCAAVALVTVFSNMSMFAASAEQAEIDTAAAAAEHKQNIGEKPLRSNDEQEYLFFTGVKVNGSAAPVRILNDDSIYREGWQTMLAEDTLTAEQLKAAVPVFELASSDLAVLEDGIVQESGASPADLTGTKTYTLYADGTGSLTGSKTYRLNVVPRNAGVQSLYVIAPEARAVYFDDDTFGKEYFISLYNTGSADLTGVTAELTGASNVKLAEDSQVGAEAVSVAPYFAANAAARVKLVPDGTGEVEGVLTIYKDGAELYSIDLGGYSFGEETEEIDDSDAPQFGWGGRNSSGSDTVLRGSRVRLEDAVKYIPYSYKLNFGGQTVASENIKVTGLDEEGFSYDSATQTIFGVPQYTGMVDFDVTLNGAFTNDNMWLVSDETTQSFHVTFNVLDNTDENVWNYTDEGYEVKQPIGEYRGNYHFVKTYHSFGRTGYGFGFDDMWGRTPWDDYGYGYGYGNTGWNGDTYPNAPVASTDDVPSSGTGVSTARVAGYPAGAEYALYDADGNELCRWISSDPENYYYFDIAPYLKPNSEYFVIMTAPPEGYETMNEWFIAHAGSNEYTGFATSGTSIKVDNRVFKRDGFNEEYVLTNPEDFTEKELAILSNGVSDYNYKHILHTTDTIVLADGTKKTAGSGTYSESTHGAPRAVMQDVANSADSEVPPLFGFESNIKGTTFRLVDDETGEELTRFVYDGSVVDLSSFIQFTKAYSIDVVSFPEGVDTSYYLEHPQSFPQDIKIAVSKNIYGNQSDLDELYSEGVHKIYNNKILKLDIYAPPLVSETGTITTIHMAESGTFKNLSGGDVVNHDDVPVTTDDDYIDENAYLFDALDVTNETFVSWGEFGEFTDLYLNGKKLRRGVDYYPSEGSSILEMLAKTLQNSFRAGTNTVSATFVDAEGDMHTSNQNIFVEKEQIGFGSGISEEYEEAFEASNYSGAAEAAREIASVQEIAGTPTPVQETTTENTNTGSAAKCAVSALLLLGAGAAFTCARRKREDGSDD